MSRVVQRQVPGCQSSARTSGAGGAEAIIARSSTRGSSSASRRRRGLSAAQLASKISTASTAAQLKSSPRCSRGRRVHESNSSIERAQMVADGARIDQIAEGRRGRVLTIAACSGGQRGAGRRRRRLARRVRQIRDGVQAARQLCGSDDIATAHPPPPETRPRCIAGREGASRRDTPRRSSRLRDGVRHECGAKARRSQRTEGQRDPVITRRCRASAAVLLLPYAGTHVRRASGRGAAVADLVVRGAAPHATG